MTRAALPLLQFQLRKQEFLDALPASVIKNGKVIPVKAGVATALEVGACFACPGGASMQGWSQASGCAVRLRGCRAG